MSELTPERRAENLRLWNQLQDMDATRRQFRELSITLVHDLPLYEAALTEALSLLDRVYQEAGNAASPKRRHALTPGLRDDIRDCLKAAGYFGGATP